MEQTTISPCVYRFGSFELCVETAELRKNGVRLKLQEQPFHILCALLEHPGELVPREQLRQQLWPEGTFVDFEHGLNTAIKKIRDVLGDDADSPRYIETVPRKGYRFIGAVRRDGDQAVPVAPVSSRRYWQLRTPVLVAALVLAFGLGFVLIRKLSVPSYLRIAATRQLTFTGNVSPESTIETDGRRVYYFKYADGHLYSVPVGGGAESSYATKFSHPVILHISPDGSLLLVKELLSPSGRYADRIWLLPTNGDAARPLGDIEGEAAAWSPDGKNIAFAQHNAIYLTENEGVTYRRLVDAPEDVSWIRWSPDGQRLRFTVINSKTFVSSTWETRGSGEVRPVAVKLGASLDPCCGIWTRDGGNFLFRELRDERTDYWITNENWSPFRTGKPYPLSGGGVEWSAATASPLEDKLFVVGFEGSIMSFKFDLARRQLTPFLPELSVQDPAFSPDGRSVALCQVHTERSVLWLARSDGSEWLPLTDPKLKVHHARFSPDGKRIAFMAKWPGGRWKIYWVSAGGSALHELNVPIASQADPNWMPDNQSIVFGQPPRFLAEPDSAKAIYVHNLQTGSISKLPGSDGWFSPRVSPGGRSLLALSIDEHKLALYDFSTFQWRILVANPQTRMRAPSWSPDGEWAYVNMQYGKTNSLIRTRVREGVTEEVLAFRDLIASPICWGWSFAPDGSLLISCVRPNSNIYAVHYE